MAGHPRNVILLTCDASGVMPPIARLTPDQAISTDAHQWRDIQRLWRTLQRAAAGFSLRRASTAS